MSYERRFVFLQEPFVPTHRSKIYWSVTQGYVLELRGQGCILGVGKGGHELSVWVWFRLWKEL